LSVAESLCISGLGTWSHSDLVGNLTAGSAALLGQSPDEATGNTK